MTHTTLMAVTEALCQRSQPTRIAFLHRTQQQADTGKARTSLSCGNMAHAVAASCQQDKQHMLDMTTANVAIISAYNDMLSAHAPYADYPDQIKAALLPLGHTAQVAGCVPAMCDGVTQGQPGMEMSLFSRDVIAQATAISLSHNVYDATLLLGVCDKIAPGQLIGALAYAHLPTLFIPSGPMTTGTSNDQKVAVILTWEDIDALSRVVPLLTRVYPNGPADINAFEAAGGVPTLMAHLHALGLLHADTLPAVGQFSDQLTTPRLDQGQLVWEAATPSTDTAVIAQPGSHFSAASGLRMLSGNMGNAVIKASAVDPAHRVVCAPARVFECQHEVEQAYQRGELNQDVIVVVRFNGPAANGMPELHKLMPILGNVQKMGYQVALVTDGRLSGASGKVPAALHVCPEAMHGGALASIQDGDLITLDANTGVLTCHADLSQRYVANTPQAATTWGRDLFAAARQQVSRADEGATYLFP
ncbi:hypothetical protein BZG79_07885 [Salinivibrio sp. MA427]|uniref:dihydroxy-acid dehydratase domain-containing protein n=1 Tax=Salinivibrio sp. MA427 TaxID=1909455 RepID=UPI00098B6381|nr:dihydroxy-acid dehydratase [Salinivibrio sp. MA427]OOF13714.1 hypothetical protein BZG79_07885 [Salinivibrio sp. MA427]